MQQGKAISIVRSELYGYHGHEGTQMRNVNVAELKLFPKRFDLPPLR
jgi:hypothetical protein